jgi:hypothetical protein
VGKDGEGVLVLLLLEIALSMFFAPSEKARRRRESFLDTFLLAEGGGRDGTGEVSGECEKKRDESLILEGQDPMLTVMIFFLGFSARVSVIRIHIGCIFFIFVVDFTIFFELAGGSIISI